ncbi:MAG: GyrI-like domain-containing protein [Anaerolineales bacterium]|nr:GyrI-like domain-containing protein [Anaerolineales bacterium]
MATKIFPDLRLARFIHKGLGRDLGLTRDYIYHTWLPKSGRRLGPALEIEDYGENPASFAGEETEMALSIPLQQR